VRIVIAAWSAMASSRAPSASPHASARLLKTVNAPIGPDSTVSGADITEWSPVPLTNWSAPEPCGKRVSLM
jgi:hypothetical protein